MNACMYGQDRAGVSSRWQLTDLPPHSWLSWVSQPGENMERPAPAESISFPVSIFWFRSHTSSCNGGGRRAAGSVWGAALLEWRQAPAARGGGGGPAGRWLRLGGMRWFISTTQTWLAAAGKPHGPQFGPTLSSTSARTARLRRAGAWRLEAVERAMRVL